MTKLEAAKIVANLVVSVGIGAIVGNAVKSTTPVDTKGIAKLCVMLGGCVLASMVSEKASEFTEEKIDSTIEQVKEAIKETSEN